MKTSLFKNLLYLIMLPAAMCFCSCGGDDNDDNDNGNGNGGGTETPVETITVSVSPAVMEFAYDGSETQELVIKSNKFVKAVCDDSWCTLTTASSSTAGEYKYNVTCAANKDKASREATIRIMQVNTQLSFALVIQAGRPDSGIAEATACLWGLGWNYGNQLDAHNNGVAGETFWTGTKATQATFDGVKKAGFQSVRIPITWMGHIGAAPDYKIEDAYMDRVAEVVGYAEKAGLQAVINIHHDGADSKYWLNVKEAATSQDKEKSSTEELVAIWKQIATRFKDKGEFLMFETMNEIHDGGGGWGENRNDGGKQYGVLNRWNQACVDVIREVGGENATRWIGVPGYCTNIDLTLESMVVPTDPANRIAVAVHCYDPYAFTLECSKNNYSASDIQNLDKQFARLKETYLDNGIQCYIGEFGCAQRANDNDEKNRISYLQKYAETAKKYGLSIMLWDNANDNGGKGGNEANAFMNHTTGDYFSAKGQAAVEALVKAYYQ